MSELELIKLGDLVNFKRGYDLPKSDFIEGNYPVQSSNGILGYHDTFKATAPGITIGRSGTVGIPQYIEKKYFPHNTTLYVDDFKGNFPKYIYYILRNLNLNDWKSGSGVPTLNRNHIHPLKIRATKNLKTQKSIAKILSDLDAKIELNNKINQELEAKAKLLYDYWFVQFDFPDENGKPYKSSRGKMVYNKELNREIPEGWKVKSLKDIESNIITGKTPSTKFEENFGGDILFITIDDIRQNLYILSSERTLSKRGANTQKNKFIYKNDICVSCIGTVGVIGFNGRISQTNQQINTISKPKDYNRYFLFNYLKDYFNFNVGAKNGAVFSNMNKGEFEAIKVLDAPVNLKEDYFKKTDDSFKTIAVNIEQNQKLAELRDWLLPMLMNGQVSVSEIKEKGVRTVQHNFAKATFLGAHVVNKNLNKNFSKVKLQKLIHLVDYQFDLNLGGTYTRKTAGPHNELLMNSIHDSFRKYGFFNIIPKKHEKTIYKPSYSASSATARFQEKFKNHEQIDNFLDLFVNFDYNSCEIISTLYAVWNNRLIKEQPITDDLLLQDFLHWSGCKKQYEDRILDALKWMRDNNIIPKGNGQYIDME